jgi:hypothetical protein
MVPAAIPGWPLTSANATTTNSSHSPPAVSRPTTLSGALRRRASVLTESVK